jgi:hypothetical protein
MCRSLTVGVRSSLVWAPRGEATRVIAMAAAIDRREVDIVFKQ